MRFKLYFQTTSGTDEEPEDEVCRRLLELVAKIEAEGISVSLRPDLAEYIKDGDGNVIGEYTAEEF